MTLLSLQQETRAARARSVSKVVALFKQLNVDVVTRWRTAHSLVLESQEWKHDLELQKLPTLDILLAFEDYSRVREREYEDQMRKTQVEKIRKERKAREAFKVGTWNRHTSLIHYLFLFLVSRICFNRLSTLVKSKHEQSGRRSILDSATTSAI